MDKYRVRCGAKEVLLDEEHFADAVSEEAAQFICDCINYSGAAAIDWPKEAYERAVRMMQ